LIYIFANFKNFFNQTDLEKPLIDKRFKAYLEH